MTWSLRTKILLSVGLTIFFAQGISTLVHMHELKQAARNALNLRFEALAQSLVANITERDQRMSVTSTERTPEAVHTTLQAAAIVELPQIYALNKDKGVLFIALINPESVFASHVERDKWNTPVQNARLREYLAQREQMTVLVDETYQALVPVFGQDDVYLGTITIGSPRALVDAQIRDLALKPLLLRGLFMLIALTMISGFMRRFVTQPVYLLMNAIERVANGELDVQAPVNTADEFGQLATQFNQMTSRLNALVGQVQLSGIQVTSSTTELAATAKEQELIVTSQADSTVGVLAQVQEISDRALRLAGTMQQVASASQETAGFANSGQQDLIHMKDVMQRIEQASFAISGRLQAIHSKAENISTVVSTITTVADQTNLLSLNAAIEAEKAGEYGRGFTVVAREIRRLADQTAVATLDIEQMVEEMRSAVSAGVMEIEKFIAEVRRSTEDVENISLQLKRIIEQVQALTPDFARVNQSMEQQAGQAQNISLVVRQLSEEMQATKSSLHDTFLAIEQLKDVAVTLQQQVTRFKVE
ncbi:MAG: HAMP domain-containing protein [bacterium]|nr:HAMP domain-containing protein [bacterium]